MEETIAELRRQIEEQQRLREAAERREEEERKAREDAERRVQPNSLFRLLDRCHNSLSKAIRVEVDATLTTQGDAADPVNRVYPKHIIPWRDFPQLQEQIWDKFDRNNAFTTRPLFPSYTQIDYVVMNIQNRPIYSEVSLGNFERDTVDNFVEKVIEVLRDDEPLRDEFGIQGRVSFYDRANPLETSLENSLDQMNPEDAQTPQRPANTRRGRSRGRGRGAARRQTRDGTARRRNRRADQFCVHLVADERKMPVIDSGVRYGYICTGEAFVFLHIPKDDPTIIQYFLCIPNQDEQADVQADVQVDDEVRLHRTAIGQVLAFTLQALAVEPPTQKWHNVAHDQLTTWKVEYLDVLREIPETLRKDPPASNYRPSHWKPDRKIHNTRARARARYQPGAATPKHSSTEGSGSDRESHSPSAAAASRIRSSRGPGNHRQPTRGGERTRAGRDHKQTSRKDGLTTRPYCTIACIRGLANREPLDKNCPNWKLHGGPRHSIGPQEFTRQLHRQLARDREFGFEQLHVCGRTGYFIKATLLSRGYTVIMKATTVEKQHRLQTEVDNYHRLRNLQGQYIPVCLGGFKPRIAYWYHGRLMAQMMILSWSGTRLQHAIHDGDSRFFHQERDRALTALRSRGVVHCDSEWRNMLWDGLSHRLVVIDLEDVEWLKRPRALESVSANTRRTRCVRAMKYKPGLERVYIPQHGSTLSL
ncbi:hypothetical protein CBS63078_11031 [Aspergillus niger]|nr:hypothetical protein CBS63078_11031 [Aspergillus niger]